MVAFEKQVVELVNQIWAVVYVNVSDRSVLGVEEDKDAQQCRARSSTITGVGIGMWNQLAFPG